MKKELLYCKHHAPHGADRDDFSGREECIFCNRLSEFYVAEDSELFASALADARQKLEKQALDDLNEYIALVEDD